MPVCAVSTCKNSHKTRKNCPDIILHRFPRDTRLANTWIFKCKRKDKINTLNAVICSQHFTSADYERDLRNELLNLPSKKFLKKDATPSKLLPTAKVIPDGVTPRMQRIDRRNKSALIANILTGSQRVGYEDRRNRRLTSDAVETEFCDTRSVPKFDGKRKRSLTTKTNDSKAQTESKRKRQNLLNNEESQPNIVKLEIIKKSMPSRVQKENSLESPSNNNETQDIDLDRDSNISIKEENFFQYCEDDASNSVFNFPTLLQEKHKIVLPNENWIVRIINEKSERSLSIISLGRLESDYIVVDKTCKINEQLEVSVRINRIQRVSGYPDRVENTQAISELLQKLDSIKMCPGVGKCNAILNCNLAVQRGSHWFSASCDKILRDDNETLCKSCCQLNNYLLLQCTE